MSSATAPIALFVYNRPRHTREAVEALSQNALASRSDLHIFSDGPKNPADAVAVEEVRAFIRGIGGFRSVAVHEETENKGLARSLIDGITSVLQTSGRVIVLEDDLLTSPHFLTFMNDALEMYATDERVSSVHGYCYPVPEALPETFFLRGADCWGWATWKRAWNVFEEDASILLRSIRKRELVNEFNWDGSYDNERMLEGVVRGSVDSWAIRWHASAFLRGMVTLYPGRSLVANIGEGDSATHTHGLSAYRVRLSDTPIRLVQKEPAEDRGARRAVVAFLRSIRAGLARRVLGRIYRAFVPPRKTSYKTGSTE